MANPIPAVTREYAQKLANIAVCPVVIWKLRSRPVEYAVKFEHETARMSPYGKRIETINPEPQA